MAESKEEQLYNDLRNFVKNQDKKIESQVSKSVLSQMGSFFQSFSNLSNVVLIFLAVATISVGLLMYSLRADMRSLKNELSSDMTSLKTDIVSLINAYQNK